MSTIEVGRAREILGGAVLGLDEVRGCLGEALLADLDPSELSAADRVPFTDSDLTAAAHEGCLLVFRVSGPKSRPLTIVRLGTLIPDALDPHAHTGVGYALRDEWTLESQSFATEEAPSPGWALVRKEPLADTFNKTRIVQDGVLAGLPHGARAVRRSAVEIVYDTLVWHGVHGERLLADAWDWSRSASTDGGFAAVGAFAPTGLRVVAYSPAVRFGSLGVCIQH